MSFNEKMTTIANETRFLVGSTDLMGLDDIAQNLNDANAEVDAQTYLLQQVMDTVNNLPEAGSGGGSSVELATVSCSIQMLGTPTVHYLNDSLQYATMTLDGMANPMDTFSVVKNSIIVLTEKPQSQTGSFIYLTGSPGCYPYVITGTTDFSWM